MRVIMSGEGQSQVKGQVEVKLQMWGQEEG